MTNSGSAGIGERGNSEQPILKGGGHLCDKTGDRMEKAELIDEETGLLHGGAMKGYYIHKEPVLDQKAMVHGYEIVFRRVGPQEPGKPYAPVPLDREVIDAVREEGGFEKLTGSKQTFVSVAAQTLDSDALKPLPGKSVVQVSEKEAADKEVFLRSCALKKQQAFQIGIDYTLPGHGLLPLHEAADFVRIDTLSATPDDVESGLALFKQPRPKLIASNMPDWGSFDRGKKRGFDLFQGPFYIEPGGEVSESISSSQALLIQLSSDLKANREVSLIENAFKHSPKLTYGLLKLMNSAFFGARQKVTSIRHAITLLGYENLQKWVILLLFTIDRTDDQSNPLIEKAVVRGRVMELLAKEAGEKAVVDSAFITGMLSFISLLFNVSSDEVTQKMNLSQEIQDALLKKEGPLGALLKVAEKMDRQEYEAMHEDVQSLNLTVGQVLAAETDAIIESHAALGSAKL